MASINSTGSTYTDAAYSSGGFSSMISGLDTEGLVKSMLSGIQTKIDKQNQTKQQLLWKQEAYRDVITKVNDFQNKYFNLTSPTCLRSNELFNTVKYSSSSSAVTISASNTAALGNTSIQVARLATATTITSLKAANAIELDPTQFSFDRSVTFSAGENSYSVDLAGVSSAQDAADAINAALTDTGITATAGENGAISFSGGDFTVSGSALGLEALGVKDGSSSSEGKLTTGVYNGEVEPTISINLSGVTKNFTLSEQDTVNDLQSKVRASFGSSIRFTESDGKWSVTSGAGQSVTISGKGGGLEALGLDSPVSTRINLSGEIGSQNLSTALELGAGEEKYSFSINGEQFEFEATATANEIMQKINESDAGVKMTYNELNDVFMLTANETGEGFDIDLEDNTGNMLTALFGNATEVPGQNALFNLNGSTVERTSNVFTVNNMTITLNDVTGSYQSDGEGGVLTYSDGTFAAVAGTYEEKAQLTTQRDTEKIVATLKGFAEDYNALIKDLNAKTHEEAKYKQYAPLTDEQKKDMSDSEIEKWEKASQTGLLHGDSDINSFLSSMRTAISSNTGTKYVFSNIGIDTSSEWKDFGKLIIDDKALTEVLEKDPSGVAELFAGSNGIASRLNSIASATASTSSGSPGTLVSLAGVVGKATEKSNTINSQLNSIADKIDRLKNQYEMQKTRYWSQFNAMEEALSNLNSTSSFFTNMLGG